MRANEVTPLTHITDESQARTAKARLAAVQVNIMNIDQQIEELTEQRGDALGSMELGISGAQKRADDLGLKIAALDAQRSDQEAITRALTAALGRWQVADQERRGAAAAEQLVTLEAEARELEQTFAKAMIEAAHTARRLRALHKQMAKLQPALFHSGRPFDERALPRAPFGIMLGFLKDPEKRMAHWLQPKHRHVNQPTPEFVPTFADGRRINHPKVAA